MIEIEKAIRPGEVRHTHTHFPFIFSFSFSPHLQHVIARARAVVDLECFRDSALFSLFRFLFLRAFRRERYAFGCEKVF